MTGRILIADGVTTNRIILKARLIAAAYTVEQAPTGVIALGVVHANPPDLIILATTLPDFDPASFCLKLRELPFGKSIPVITIGSGISREQRIAALNAGSDAVLESMPDDALLRARIRNLMRRRTSESELARDISTATSFGFAELPQPSFRPAAQITIVAPSKANGLKWRNNLKGLIRDNISVLNPQNALHEVDREPPPDAILIEDHPDHPEMALQLLSDLRCRSQTFRSAIIVVQSTPHLERAIMALDLGVSELVESGFNAAEVALLLRRELARKARNEQHRATVQHGLRLAVTDPLTGLFNRRYAETHLDAVAEEAANHGGMFAVLALDLDRFKRINDSFGHPAGDAVLKEVSARLSACLRRDDLLARMGGEEFLAVIPVHNLADAHCTAERLREVIADTPVHLPGGREQVDVTISIGLVIGGTANSPQDADALINLADRGLYAAKADGRNQVTMCKSAA